MYSLSWPVSAHIMKMIPPDYDSLREKGGKPSNIKSSDEKSSALRGSAWCPMGGSLETP